MTGLQDFKYHVLKDGNEYITSDYKTRNTKRPTHTGIDFVRWNGKNKTTAYITAIDEGVVYKKGYSATGSGYYIWIKHNNGFFSIYCHMKKGSLLVNKGDKVSKGQNIGYMGSTGNSTGAHLHFGIKNTNQVVIDPLPYLKGDETFDNKSKDEYWTKGSYKLLYDKYIRKTPEIRDDNYVKVKECTSAMKKALTSVLPNAKAKVKAEKSITALSIVKDKEGRIYAENYSGYICLCNADGTKQATKNQIY